MRLRGSELCREASRSRMARRPIGKIRAAGIFCIAVHSDVQLEQVLPHNNSGVAQVGTPDDLEGGPSQRSSRCARVWIRMSGVYRRFW